ncbi:MAG TPA: IS91 family transposase [Nitrospiraceae bacterium]|nr:IS91 family transposase [Nitrospiraceae bacterium]
MQRPRGVEVADVFRHHGPEYRQSHRLPLSHLRVMRAVEVCRTAELGGHKDKCVDCGHIEISYNSCRNRHCPKCQTLRKERWIEDRAEDLLPIEYFHVVFTIPSELNPLAIMNQKVMYNLLFRSASETLIELADNPKHLGARIGFIAILHTWGQNLMDHPHVHCVVTGGGLKENDWVSSRKGFFIPVRVMSALFRGKFLDYFKKSYDAKKIELTGSTSHLADPYVFDQFLRKLYHKKWVVYCKPPFNGIEGVLNYLSRYTHRVAISNERILKVENGEMTFKWRDYADGDKEKIMTLEAGEFIRRFLLHILPHRYVKIRHVGLLANRKRKHNIALCRQFLGSENTQTNKSEPKTWQEHMLEVSGIDVTRCPVCRKGRMVTIDALDYFRCNSPPVKC